ncbi:MAG: hypothetical protein ACK4ME_10420 [Fimbriimonadales bacterium]
MARPIPVNRRHLENRAQGATPTPPPVRLYDTIARIDALLRENPAPHPEPHEDCLDPLDEMGSEAVEYDDEIFDPTALAEAYAELDESAPVITARYAGTCRVCINPIRVSPNFQRSLLEMNIYMGGLLNIFRKNDSAAFHTFYGRISYPPEIENSANNIRSVVITGNDGTSFTLGDLADRLLNSAFNLSDNVTGYYLSSFAALGDKSIKNAFVLYMLYEFKKRDYPSETAYILMHYLDSWSDPVFVDFPLLSTSTTQPMQPAATVAQPTVVTPIASVNRDQDTSPMDTSVPSRDATAPVSPPTESDRRANHSPRAHGRLGA